MASPILDKGANVVCSHGGQASPAMASTRVSVAGAPIVMIADEYAVSGCGFVPPAGNGPCVKGQWITGALRVTSEGRPVAITTGTSLCEPTGTPLVVGNSQKRVQAT